MVGGLCSAPVVTPTFSQTSADDEPVLKAVCSVLTWLEAIAVYRTGVKFSFKALIGNITWEEATNRYFLRAGRAGFTILLCLNLPRLVRAYFPSS
jgi:hypothetical protein